MSYDRKDLLNELRDVEKKLQGLVRRLWWNNLLLDAIILFSLIGLMLGILRCL